MKPFTQVSGAAAPLLRDNIDTDVIIRIERLTSLPRSDLGRYALEALRLRPDGSEDPACPLNEEPFRAAPILLAGVNFGCGSSRESAVWALMGRGVRCVIAPSFGDIFFGNCFQNGLLPVCLPAEQVQMLADECRRGAPMTVDLQQQTLTSPGASVLHFDVDPLRRAAMLKGLDDVGMTLEDDAAIRAWQQQDRVRRPWVWSAPAELAR